MGEGCVVGVCDHTEGYAVLFIVNFDRECNTMSSTSLLGRVCLALKNSPEIQNTRDTVRGRTTLTAWDYTCDSQPTQDILRRSVTLSVLTLSQAARPRAGGG